MVSYICEDDVGSDLRSKTKAVYQRPRVSPALVNSVHNLPDLIKEGAANNAWQFAKTCAVTKLTDVIRSVQN